MVYLTEGRNRTQLGADTCNGVESDVTAEPKTILQNIRYVSKNEQIQYVCHADDETLENERRALAPAASMFTGAPQQVREKENLVSAKKCAIKRERKLVRFRSRNDIFRDDQCVDYSHLKHASDRPGTPKPFEENDDSFEENTSLIFPSLTGNAMEKNGPQNRIKKSPRKGEKRYDCGSPLAASPPDVDSLLKKVLKRGAFSGSAPSIQKQTKTLSNSATFSPLLNRKSRPAQRSQSLRKAHVKANTDVTSSNDSSRSTSLTRDTDRCSNHMSRDSMTSPLTMLHQREDSCNNLSKYPGDYPVLSSDEHINFIRHALTGNGTPPTLRRDAPRSRASTVGGGEGTELLLTRQKLQRRLLSNSNPTSNCASVEKLNFEKKIDKVFHRRSQVQAIL